MKSPRTLQEFYNAAQNGTGAKDVFLKEAKQLYSSLIPNAATFDQTVKILKNKSVLNENYIDLKPIGGYEGRELETWETKFKSFLKEQEEEAVKADSTKVSKYAEDAKKKGYDNSDVKNLDNQIGQEVLNGIAFEARENPIKTLDEIRAIVSKNLAKDQLYYVKNAMFGIKGVGISDEIPGMKASKTDQMTPVKMKSINESIIRKGDIVIDKRKGNEFLFKIDDFDHNSDELDLDEFPETEISAIQVDKNGNYVENSYGNTMFGSDISSIVKKNINESKASKLDQRLKDIHKAGDIVTLEAKMEAIDEEINAKNERINMIGENEDLAELVNPIKLREMKKEIKNLEREKAKLQKVYEKMTGQKKAEVIDEPQEVENEVTPEVDEEAINENIEDVKVFVKETPRAIETITLSNMRAEYVKKVTGGETFKEDMTFKTIDAFNKYPKLLAQEGYHLVNPNIEINESSVFQFRLKK